MKFRNILALLTLVIPVGVSAMPMSTINDVSRTFGVEPEVVLSAQLELGEGVDEYELSKQVIKIFNVGTGTDTDKYLSYDSKLSVAERQEILEEANRLYSRWEITQPRWVIDRDRLGGKPLKVTSQYAYRSGGQMHRALDFGTRDYIGENGEVGELNLYPVQVGTVVRIEHNPKAPTGLAVWYDFVMDGSVYRVVYMHMSSVEVEVGQVVDTDTVLGTVGETGDANGVHLHMQVEKDGTRVNPLRLWGYNPEWSLEDRLDWFYDMNLSIVCGGECTEFLNYTHDDREFSVVPCREHRKEIYNMDR